MIYHDILLQERNNCKKSYEKSLASRALGRFYTPEKISSELSSKLLKNLLRTKRNPLKIIDPFCGDGGLVASLLKQKTITQIETGVDVYLWDCDPVALQKAYQNVKTCVDSLSLNVEINKWLGDSFRKASTYFGEYDIVITNPPWELLKPDCRELNLLSKEDQEEYLNGLKIEDEWLSVNYPISQPSRKMYGWGTNLAKVGTEVALRLSGKDGVCGIVSPATLFADQTSAILRKWIFDNFELKSISYFPAETRLFNNVDQPAITFVAKCGVSVIQNPMMTVFNGKMGIITENQLYFNPESFRENAYSIPLLYSNQGIKILSDLSKLPTFRSLEGKEEQDLWAGRELDETRSQRYLSKSGEFLFVKGKMIQRYRIAIQPSLYIRKKETEIPESSNHFRIAWRDVSRQSQKRRMFATIIPPGWISGNSLNIAYFRDDDQNRLFALLLVMNSLVFEYQVRAFLSTPHVSLGTVRGVHIPDLNNKPLVKRFAEIAIQCLKGDEEARADAEIAVARAYGLNKKDFNFIVDQFIKIQKDERDKFALSPLWSERSMAITDETEGRQTCMIPNHYSAKLSDLDLDMVMSVPPGGNWKNIPHSIPSKRLDQIRLNCMNGNGTRSTYYGRLNPDAPSYTISTYFNRPGNGCFMHYDFKGGQHRLISQREAARLQSFPDNFEFFGNRSEINKQIGNAVPPLLAYQIASTFPFKGLYVDLFCGAGGLSLGFQWAGWQHVVANDVDPSCLKTYNKNLGGSIIQGDICDSKIFQEIIDTANSVLSKNRKHKTIVIGGPPCQGFSTAGNKRSMQDARNHLFKQYAEILKELKPDAFIFENVIGLLNMEKGEVLRLVLQTLTGAGYKTNLHILKCEEFGIPQRRARVFIYGTLPEGGEIAPPRPITDIQQRVTLYEKIPKVISVKAALDDLPPLKPNEDGSNLCYIKEPENLYQKYCRGLIKPQEYISSLND